MVDSNRIMHPVLFHVDHRPWPLPGAAWIWRQSWLDLAFIHYRVRVEDLQRRLPEGVNIQEFDGSAWLGLVPFRMDGMMRRGFPALPGFSSFPELNLRTYVEVGGKPGVWFFSLDADSWAIVFGGRRFYGLPYYRAGMVQRKRGEWFEFESLRREGGVRCCLEYRGVGEVFCARAGTFEHFVAERYCLYSADRAGRLIRVEVHHPPWPLQRAEVGVKLCGILRAASFSPVSGEPVCHFSSGVDVVSFAAEDLGGLVE